MHVCIPKVKSLPYYVHCTTMLPKGAFSWRKQLLQNKALSKKHKAEDCIMSVRSFKEITSIVRAVLEATFFFFIVLLSPRGGQYWSTLYAATLTLYAATLTLYAATLTVCTATFTSLVRVVAYKVRVAAYKVRVAAYKVDQYCPPLGERRTMKKKVCFKLQIACT